MLREGCPPLRRGCSWAEALGREAEGSDRDRLPHREGPEVTAGGKAHGRQAAAQNKRLPLGDRNDGHSGSAGVEEGSAARDHRAAKAAAR